MYDPMRLYARLLREYRGGIRDADFATMHYERFFGYVQELDIMLHEEQSEQKKGDNTLCEFPKPEEYTGETIKLI